MEIGPDPQDIGKPIYLIFIF